MNRALTVEMDFAPLPERETRPVVLTIAGFDPSSGAGITADLKVFAAEGLYGLACITALTVQSTLGVKRVEAVSAQTVADTLSTLAEDVSLAGIKVGMLATAEITAAVGNFLEQQPGVPTVVDPVFRSSSGHLLLEEAAIPSFRTRLLTRANWITPNIDELAILSGQTVLSRADVPSAAGRLKELAADLGNPQLNILVTGGHLPKPDDYLLTGAQESAWIPGEPIQTRATHGTGCALSSALLCRLVLGDQPRAAAAHAKAYVTTSIKCAYAVGTGRGPIHHLFALDELPTL